MGEGERERTGEYEETRTPVEEVLAGIWAEVLKVERIGAEENFFEMGGHSLLATQVMSRVREGFGVEIALRELFEHPTVRELGERIEEELRGGAGKGGGRIERVSREGLMPLSFAQQRLWFIDQLDPDTHLYNIPAAVRLGGQLNLAALEQTLSEILRRHEVLRTVFAEVDRQPVQVIREAGAMRLEVTDLSVLPQQEREAEARRLAREEAQRAFNLATGPLMRASVLRLGDEEHIILFTMHHIISDGWSMGVLVREVATLYSAFHSGEPSPLAELPVQYADYAHWQRGWLQGEVLEQHLSYWRGQLADAPAVLELPTDRQRPAVQTFNGASQSFMLSTELAQGLKDLSRREGVTLYMTLLAAFQTLLYRYSGQEDILVGSPIANRNRGETEALIGFFVNTLVLRSRINPAGSFRELLRQVRETALGAYTHQDVPLEKLVEELQPERSLSHSPLFQVVFTLQNTPMEALELPGLSLSSISDQRQSAKYDLVLNMVDLEQGLVTSLEYNTDLFDASSITRMLIHFERLLESIVSLPGESLSALEFFSEEEKTLIEETINIEELDKSFSF
jgi:acyl carrier protein